MTLQEKKQEIAGRFFQRYPDQDCKDNPGCMSSTVYNNRLQEALDEYLEATTQGAKTITIGDRDWRTITPDELGSIIYNHGFCAAYEWFEKPVFTEWEYKPGALDSIFFTFTQARKDGTLTVTREGSFSIEESEYFASLLHQPSIYLEGFGTKHFHLLQIKDLIKIGIDIKLY